MQWSRIGKCFNLLGGVAEKISIHELHSVEMPVNRDFLGAFLSYKASFSVHVRGLGGKRRFEYDLKYLLRMEIAIKPSWAMFQCTRGVVKKISIHELKRGAEPRFFFS